jgi:hypothetical protein
MQVLWICRYIVNTRRKFHYAETVFKPLVSCSWVDEICQGKLVNFSQPLIRLTVDEFALIRVEPNKAMNRISYFVHRLIIGWCGPPLSSLPPVLKRICVHRNVNKCGDPFTPASPLLTVPSFVPTPCIEAVRTIASGFACMPGSV